MLRGQREGALLKDSLFITKFLTFTTRLLVGAANVLSTREHRVLHSFATMRKISKPEIKAGFSPVVASFDLAHPPNPDHVRYCLYFKF